MKKVFLSALVLSTMAMEAQQSFSGFRESPYAGVLQATTNPAYMISSKRSWDASLFVLNVGVNNDAIPLDADINKRINDFVRLDASNPLAKNNDINVRFNVDVLGPSVFVKLNDKHAVGIFTRVRALGNINNFDAKMIQSYISDYDKLELRNNYSLNLNDQEVVVHGFSEVGFSWAGELYFDGHNAIKAGASLKYIMGAGNLYAGFRDFNGTASLTTDPVTKKVNKSDYKFKINKYGEVFAKNGERVWGYPDTQDFQGYLEAEIFYIRITFVGKEPYLLPKTKYLFNPALSSVRVYDRGNGQYMIDFMGGDGAEGYNALFVFDEKGLIKRYLYRNF